VTEKHVALVAETEREVAERFTAYGLTEPDEKAAALIRWLKAHGWRVHPALSDGPPSRPIPAPRAVAEAALADMRQTLADKAEHRPERGTDCDCRGCRPAVEEPHPSHPDLLMARSLRVCWHSPTADRWPCHSHRDEAAGGAA
jgi:hypothetical protein